MKTNSGLPDLNLATTRKILSVDRLRPRPDESLSDTLSAASLVQDKELAHIVQDVDQILKCLRTDTPQAEAINNALQRTVLTAMKQSLLERELRSLALTDDLTCLYNRRAFLALSAQQVRVARRRREGLLLFFADVDDLKVINDSYGHQEGDLALLRAADALEMTFRDSDIIARVGGDEFSILALEASGQNRDVILRRLEENVRKCNSGEFRYQLSLSVGVARLDPENFVPLGELMSQADQAMYEEKRRRRYQRELAATDAVNSN